MYNVFRSLKFVTVPNRVWNINELTEEEVNELRFELDYAHKDERWWEQEPLKLLDLSYNSLTTIDPKLECLTDLTTLLVRVIFIATI